MIADNLLKAFGAIGAKRTWILVLLAMPVLLAYVVAYSWLATRIGWPEAFDVQCNTRRCGLTYIFNSYKLLGGKDIFAYLFFVVLNLPTFVIISSVVASVIYGRRLEGRTK